MISAQKSVKCLRIEIDQHVSGEDVANDVIRKANSRPKFLYRHEVISKCFKLLFSALIQGMFDYFPCSWFAGFNAIY